MKILKTLVLLLIPIISFSQKIITSDIDNFWNAYDKIIVEKDSVKQLNLIQTLYINKGTPGLDGIMRARIFGRRIRLCHQSLPKILEIHQKKYFKIESIFQRHSEIN